MQLSEHVTDDGADVDDGVLEDSAEVVVGAVENLVNSDVIQKAGEVAAPAIGVVHDALREGVKKGTEVVHGATRAVNAACGVTSRGMPEIEGVDEVAEGYLEAIETQAEGLAESAGEAFDTLKEKAPAVLDAVDPSGALEETAKHAGEAVVGLMGGEFVEEVMESVTEVVPGVGVIVPSYHLIHGTGKVAAGVSSLVTGGVMAFVGGVYGAAAAPFDGGAAWGKVMNVSRKPSAWGASMSAEGGLIAAKGAVGYANQVCNVRTVLFSRQDVFVTLPYVLSPSRSLPAGCWAFVMMAKKACLADVFPYQVPGSQVATIPAKIACKIGAKWINRQRNSR